ncbi:glucosamine-6-phosphate deaminase [Colidextribacter sp. OB.20]|uniref:glucosamine-6-phosphate deaminase n=1 Tax=Colidextribacter sp. OB.20 TaxID=2304568 RepID=UPI00136CD7F3|nr:glucosamine-6-phosphate deaminase [Colidextribacter sp. OB.20]NBI11071.1 glucosamine-6-phosphate deaminase [Colidextribacter sp. OB.20]
MKIYREKDYDAMSRRAAQIIAGEITHNPACALGLATGSTPEGAYKYLVDWYKQGLVSFRDVLSVNLDEYVGLAPDHDQSYRYFMQSNLFDHVDILPENTRVPDGLTKDPEAFCAEYDAYIRSLGYVNLQLLGIGRNGHIGFNEPGDHFVKETHVVDLTESTIDANARFFASRDDVPRQAISMGMGAIMGAKKVLLCASGEDKADAICRSVSGPITPECPGSILQLHKNVVLVADEAALSKLIAAGVEV